MLFRMCGFYTTKSHFGKRKYDKITTKTATGRGYYFKAVITNEPFPKFNTLNNEDLFIYY